MRWHVRVGPGAVVEGVEGRNGGSELTRRATERCVCMGSRTKRKQIEMRSLTEDDLWSTGTCCSWVMFCRQARTRGHSPLCRGKKSSFLSRRPDLHETSSHGGRRQRHPGWSGTSSGRPWRRRRKLRIFAGADPRNRVRSGEP